jgi:hypothetical protein
MQKIDSKSEKQTIKQTKQTNNQTIHDPRCIYFVVENPRVAPVFSEASARTSLVLLDAVRANPQTQ